MNDTDRAHLAHCIDLAEQALDAGDQPFGSLLVDGDGTVLFTARNRVGGGDHTRHPEFEIARWAAEHLPPERRRPRHCLHLRGTLPHVRRRSRLGGPGPHRLRQLRGAVARLAGGMGPAAVAGRP